MSSENVEAVPDEVEDQQAPVVEHVQKVVEAVEPEEQVEAPEEEEEEEEELIEDEAGLLDEEEEEEEDEDEDEDEEILQLHDDEDSFDEDDEDLLPGYDITLNGLSSYLHALDLGLDLPTVDLTNQGIGDKGIIDLLDKLVQTDKLNSVCTLKLDGNDIEVAGACKLAECLTTNDTITFVDLKWNLVGVGGTTVLGEALEHNTTLVSLNLDGNELGEEGAEALAHSLMKNRGLKYLELKDNAIGDVGARALAIGLSAQTDMVLLDLTSNDIHRNGARAIAHYLVGPQEDYVEELPDDSPLMERRASLGTTPSYTLETLILNNNNIGDEGAIALGSALRDNVHLHSLQLRKCGISTDGVVAITVPLTEKDGNVHVTELDMNSNNCGVRGEIALNDMMMNKPELYVEWKDVTQESTWNINEIHEIIQHYGVSEILSNILRGFSLVPLIENYKLLGALDIDDQAVADDFVASAFSTELLSHGLSMIVTILNQGEEEDDDYFEEVMDETEASIDQLPDILRAVYRHLDVLKEKLVVGNTTPVPYACGDVLPLGETRLKVLHFITNLVRQNTSSLTERIVELGLHNIIVNMMAQYPLNNILHFEIVRFVQAACRTRQLKVALCDKETGILNFIIDRSMEEWERPLNVRGGYSGHLAVLAREIVALENEDSEISEMLQANADWQAFVLNDLHAYTQVSVWQETYV